MNEHGIMLIVAVFSVLLGGAGMFKLLTALARRVDPALPIQERGVKALETIAIAAPAVNENTRLLTEMRDMVQEFSISFSALAKEFDELKRRRLPCEDPRWGCNYGKSGTS